MNNKNTKLYYKLKQRPLISWTTLVQKYKGKLFYEIRIIVILRTYMFFEKKIYKNSGIVGNKTLFSSQYHIDGVLWFWTINPYIVNVYMT